MKESRPSIQWVLTVAISAWLLIIISAFVFSTCNAQPRKPIYTVLESNYIALQAADVVLTHKGVSLGGHEVNPIARWQIDNRILIPGKIVGTGVFLYTCRRIHRENPRLATAYLIAGNLVYGAVVYNNYQVCLKLRI